MNAYIDKAFEQIIVLCYLFELINFLDGLVQRTHLASENIDREDNSKANGYDIDYDSAGRRREGNAGAVINIEQKPNRPKQKERVNN